MPVGLTRCVSSGRSGRASTARPLFWWTNRALSSNCLSTFSAESITAAIVKRGRHADAAERGPAVERAGDAAADEVQVRQARLVSGLGERGGHVAGNGGRPAAAD